MLLPFTSHSVLPRLEEKQCCENLRVCNYGSRMRSLLKVTCSCDPTAGSRLVLPGSQCRLGTRELEHRLTVIVDGYHSGRGRNDDRCGISHRRDGECGSMPGSQPWT